LSSGIGENCDVTTTTADHPSAREALLAAAREELVEKGHASVSLRAVARRAGVSHAAPAHFFKDRAGMLTAVATEGFGMLARELGAAAAAPAAGESTLAALGRAYVDFGLEHAALVDLMFRRSELVADDPGLVAAQAGALAPLRGAVRDVTATADAEGWSLVSWAVAHGLVVLAREGALAQIAGDVEDPGTLARSLVRLYATALAPE
jgi:AcrR family transcriptional regulator